MAFAGEFVTISKADKKAGVYYLKINFGGCTGSDIRRYV